MLSAPKAIRLTLYAAIPEPMAIVAYSTIPLAVRNSSTSALRTKAARRALELSAPDASLSVTRITPCDDHVSYSRYWLWATVRC